MYQNILVPVDKGIETSKSALNEVENIASEDSEIHGIHVRRKKIEKEYPDEDMGFDPLDTFESFFEASPYTIKTSQVSGRLPKSIQEYVETHNIDVVVMETHNRSKIKELVIGSITKETIDTLKCPVLVVKRN